MGLFNMLEGTSNSPETSASPGVCVELEFPCQTALPREGKPEAEKGCEEQGRDPENREETPGKRRCFRGRIEIPA